MIGRYSDQMTFEAILSSMLDRVPNTVDKREGSVIYDALAPAAAEMAKAYIELDVIMDETFVDTASMQYLMMRCRERGVPIQPATEAVIEGTFTPASLELETGSRFNCGDQNYIVTEKVVWNVTLPVSAAICMRGFCCRFSISRVWKPRRLRIF